MEHVVTGQVLRRGTDRDGRAREDLQANLGPAALKRLKVDTTVDECLGEIAAAGLEGVDADSKGTRSVGSGEELEGLWREEKVSSG